MQDLKTPVFPAIRLPQYENQVLPQVVVAKLDHPKAPRLEDVEGATITALEKSHHIPNLPSGARTAITCGSRGIQSKPTVVKTVVSWLRNHGFEPFIVPAMGSHGGAKAETQTELLAMLGFTPEKMGCPIKATMDVVQLGTTSLNAPVWFDKYAAEADAVIVINRIKAHTSIDREIESGISKMVAIGLGKAQGANLIHRLGPRGYLEVLPEWAKIAVDNSPIIYGIGIVENAEKFPTIIQGSEPEEFAHTDASLLQIAKGYIPRLPFKQIDVLIAEKIGKNLSGSGLDPTVTGRVDIRGQADRPEPFIHKLVVLGLSPETHGNGIGIGFADFISAELANQLDLYSMYMNACTATFVERAQIPTVLADEKAVIQTAVGTSWRYDGENARLCIIKSTLHLDKIMIAPALIPDLPGACEILSEPKPIQFDNDGHLITSW